MAVVCETFFAILHQVLRLLMNYPECGCRYRVWWWTTIIAAVITGWLVTYQLAFLAPGNM